MSVRQLPKRVETSTNGKHPPTAPARKWRRPPPVVIGTAVAIVALGVFVFLTPTTSRSRSVLALRSAVAAGQPITAADLKVISLAVPKGLATIPATQEASVVGQLAQANLEPGSLLSPGSYGPAAGQWSEVGVSVKPGQYPPGLAPGAVVEAVVGPATGGNPPALAAIGTVLAPAAHVVSVNNATSSPGVAMVGLDVPPAEALELAVVGAAGQVLLVVVQP